MGWTVRDRIPVGAIFSAPIKTGRGAHLIPNIMGNGSFPGEKRLACGVDRPHPSSTEVKEREEL